MIETLNDKILYKIVQPHDNSILDKYKMLMISETKCNKNTLVSLRKS